MEVVINKILLRRKKGFLDLNRYFLDILNREFIDEEDLYNNGLIDVEISGRSDKFWIISIETGEKIALFKSQMKNSCEAYAELIAEEIANILHMKTAHNDLAIFNRQQGSISYNFLNEYDTYCSGFDLILSYYEEQLKTNSHLFNAYGIDNNKHNIDEITDKLNNVQFITTMLEDRYKQKYSDGSKVFYLINGLVDKLTFDCLTINTDDHVDNWGIINDSYICPQFDGARIFNLHHDVLFKHNQIGALENENLNLSFDNSNQKKPLEILEKLLTNGGSDYYKSLQVKVMALNRNLDKIPVCIDERTNCEMPEYIKEYFLDNAKDHLKKVKSLIKL